MTQKKSVLVKIIVAIAISILLFGSHFSSVLEILVIGLCGIAALIPPFLRLVDGGETQGKDILLCSLFIALSGSFFYWHSVNEHIRNKEKIEKELKQYIKDEIAKEKQDSIKSELIKAQSDSLYNIEGNWILGDFYFGMSKKEFKEQVDRINRDSDGYVSIQGLDFYIETNNCLFFHDQLYSIELISKLKKSIEYDYTRDEQMKIIESEEKELYNLFKGKYGEPHDEKGWHFPYKDITVFYSCVNPFDDEEYKLREWASFIWITQPTLRKQAEEERQVKKEKEE